MNERVLRLAIRTLIVAGIVFVVVVIFRSNNRTQNAPDRLASDPPAGIAVLPGYTFITRSSVSTQVGQLVKDRGPAISYEIGGSRPPIVQASDKASSVWNRSLVIRGEAVEVYMLREGELRVGFADGNFIARNVKTNEDVADVLLTALSLHADEPPAIKR